MTHPGRRWSARWATQAFTVTDDGNGLEFAAYEDDLHGTDVGVVSEPVRSEAVGESTE